jgi:hypothetical protein
MDRNECKFPFMWQLFLWIFTKIGDVPKNFITPPEYQISHKSVWHFSSHFMCTVILIGTAWLQDKPERTSL